MYSQVGHAKARWPDTSVNWRELVHMRSWQAGGLAVIAYYFILAVAVIQLISYIVVFTESGGAGGFFLGLFIGVLMLIALFIFGRISLECVLSLFAIRDAIDDMASKGAPVTSMGNTGVSFPTRDVLPNTSYQNM